MKATGRSRTGALAPRLSLALLSLSLAVLGGAALAGCPAQVDGQSATEKNQAVHSPGPATGTKAARCEEASLALDPQRVVAVVEGEEVKAADLGDELAQREDQLLRTYCEELASSREIALDNLVSEKLLEKEAEAQGKSPEDVLRSRIDAATQQMPSDEEVQQFYAERSRPGVPPLEQVRPQVIAAMQQQAAEQAVSSLLDELKGKAEVERRLPDVRPAALEVDIPAHTAAVGPEDAEVTVVEFADFECPYCSKAADAMNAVKEKFAGEPVRFAYRHFPLSFHPNAEAAAEYSQCAQHQGKFWAFHDLAYDNQQALAEPDLREYAQKVGLDMDELDKCLQSGQAEDEVEADYKKGQALGVQGTPTFFVNGRPLGGGPDEASLTQAIEQALAAGS